MRRKRPGTLRQDQEAATKREWTSGRLLWGLVGHVVPVSAVWQVAHLQQGTEGDGWALSTLHSLSIPRVALASQEQVISAASVRTGAEAQASCCRSAAAYPRSDVVQALDAEKGGNAEEMVQDVSFAKKEE